MADTVLLNTTAQLSGKTVTTAEGDYTITGAHTWDRDPSAPFAVTSGSAVVTNLDADKVDGYEGSALAVLAEAETITGLWTFNGGILVASGEESFLRHIAQGRLTLTTALPVTVADVTAAGTIYYTPYSGDQIALYDGTNWKLYTFTERSLALTATSGFPYDVFLYDNAGTLTLETLVWTNDTTRATALVLQNGVLCKTGALTRRYLGSFYATAANQTEDSYAKRMVWNYNNRVPRAMRRVETTTSWTYTTATVRQANGAAANQLEVMVGWAEVPISVRVHGSCSNTGAGVNVWMGLGEDGSGGPHGSSVSSTTTTPVAAYRVPLAASLDTYPAVGRHFYTWLEWSAAAGTTTWAGDDTASTPMKTGLSGSIMG